MRVRIHYFYRPSRLNRCAYSALLRKCSVLSITYALEYSRYTWSAPTLTWSNMIPLISITTSTHLKPALWTFGIRSLSGHNICTFPVFYVLFCDTVSFHPPISSPFLLPPPSTLDACRGLRTGYVIGQATFISYLDDCNGGQSMYHA